MEYRSIKYFSWEELNCYPLDIYPDNMRVITAADAETFARAKAKFLEKLDSRGVSTSIQEELMLLGYDAVAACAAGEGIDGGTNPCTIVKDPRLADYLLTWPGEHPSELHKPGFWEGENYNFDEEEVIDIQVMDCGESAVYHNLLLYRITPNPRGREARDGVFEEFDDIRNLITARAWYRAVAYHGFTFERTPEESSPIRVLGWHNGEECTKIKRATDQAIGIVGNVDAFFEFVVNDD